MSYKYEAAFVAPPSAMNEQEYNNQEITAYLLGASSETATERFDELSFTDDQFADALKSAETDLVDAYVQNELTGDALERFKSYYLASPLRRERLEFARAFQTFAEKNAAPKTAKSFVEETKSKRGYVGFFGWLNVFSQPTAVLQWGAVAAVLLFVVLGGWWLFVNRSGQPDNQIATREDATAPSNQETPLAVEKKDSENLNAKREIAAASDESETASNSGKELTNRQPVPAPTKTPRQTAQRSVVALILAPSLRGGSRLANVAVSKETTDVAVQLELESDDYMSYRVVLTDESGSKNFWVSGTLKTRARSDAKILNLRFPAKLLKSRIYSLTVSGVNLGGEPEIIGSYPFRSVLK